MTIKRTYTAFKWLLCSIVAATVLLPVASGAVESRWTRVDLHDAAYEDKYFMDLGSFVVMDKVVVFHGMYVTPKGMRSVQKVGIDCARGRYRVQSSALYDREGRLLEDDSEPKPWLKTSAAGFYGYATGLVCADKAPRPFGALTAIGAKVYNIRSLRGYDE